jgi:hypothetical protein
MEFAGTEVRANMEAPMRYHHAIAIAAVLAVGFAIRIFAFASPEAGAKQPINNGGIDLHQMMIQYPTKDLPVQDVENPV